jgi:serine protease Do
MVRRIVEDLVDYGTVQRGFLGVSLDARFSPQRAISMGLERAHGARVSAITPGSPAEKSDILIGDIVLEYDGHPVENDSHLVTLVSLSRLGSEVPILVYRGGKTLRLSVSVADRDGFSTGK